MARHKLWGIALLHCAHWFYYSVIIALSYLWITLAYAIWSGKDVFWPRLFDGSLLVYSLVRAATALAVHYKEISMVYKDRPAVPSVVWGLGYFLFVVFLISYVFTLTVGDPVSFNPALYAIWCGVLATWYAFACSLLDRRWMSSLA